MKESLFSFSLLFECFPVFVFNEFDMEGDLETGGKTSNGFVGTSRFLNEAQHDCSDEWSWL